MHKKTLVSQNVQALEKENFFLLLSSVLTDLIVFNLVSKLAHFEIKTQKDPGTPAGVLAGI